MIAQHTSNQRRKCCTNEVLKSPILKAWILIFHTNIWRKFAAMTLYANLFFTDKDPTFLQLHPNNFAPQEHVRLLGPLVFLAPGEPPTWVCIHANTGRLHMNYPLYGWETFLSFWGFGLFQGRAVSFREGTHPSILLEGSWRFDMQYDLPPGKSTCHLKRDHFKKRKNSLPTNIFHGI